MPSSFERILQITVLKKIKDIDISKLTGDELDWLKTRPDIMETINEAAKYNKLRDDPYYKDVISGTIEEILIDLGLQDQDVFQEYNENVADSFLPEADV